MKKLLVFLVSFMFVGVVYADEPNCMTIADPELQANCTGGSPALVDFISSYFMGGKEVIQIKPTIVNGNDTMTIKYEIISGENCITLTSDGKVTGKKDSGICTAKVRASINGLDTAESKRDYDIGIVEFMQLDPNQGEINCRDRLIVSGSVSGRPYSLDDENVLTVRDRNPYLSIVDFMVDVLPEAESIEDGEYFCEIKKEGSYFAGWYTEKTGGELVSDEESMNSIDKVYAHWSNEPIPLEELVLEKKPYVIAIPLKAPLQDNVDYEMNLKVRFVPYYATNKPKLVWSVEDDSILSVSSSGLIKGKKNGNTIVKVETEDKKYSAELEVIVGPEAANYLDPKGPVTIEVGEKTKFTYYQIGVMRVNTWATYSSSDSSIASINEITGEVTGLKPGKVTITARYGNEFSTTAELVVLGDAEHEIGEEDKRTIKFGSEDVTGSMIDIDFDVSKLTGEGITLPKSTLEKEGYILSGWKVYKITASGDMEAIKIDDEELIVEDGGVLKGFELGDGENLYLEPVWVTNPDTGIMISIVSILVLLGISGGIYLYKKKHIFKAKI